jgi:hypothetical protein
LYILFATLFLISTAVAGQEPGEDCTNQHYQEIQSPDRTWRKDSKDIPCVLYCAAVPGSSVKHWVLGEECK